MSITPISYETLVKDLANRIADSKNIRLINPPMHGRNNRIRGASEFRHQIDVSVHYESKDGIRRLKLIECKLRSSKKVSIGEVLAFYARIMDIQRRFGDSLIVEGNVFTSIGYSQPAKDFADYYDIVTNTLQHDLQAWSISYKDEVVVGLRSLTLKSAPAHIAPSTLGTKE